MRQYTKEQGQPDFDLEKFAINSVISATNTSQMTPEDQNDIINKIKKSGEDEGQPNNDDFSEPNDNGGETEELDFSSMDENLNGLEVYENLFLDKPKKNNMFQPNSNDILDEAKPCWKGYEQIGMKTMDGKEVPNCVPINESVEKLKNSEKNSIFKKNYLKMKIQETFVNHEPLVAPTKPKIKPIETPLVQPTRKNKPFLPQRESQPNPKAKNNE